MARVGVGEEAIVVGHAGHARQRRRALHASRVVVTLLLLLFLLLRKLYLQLILGILHGDCCRRFGGQASRARARYCGGSYSLDTHAQLSYVLIVRLGASSVSVSKVGRLV